MSKLNILIASLLVCVGLWQLHTYDKNQAVKSAVAVTTAQLTTEYKTKLDIATARAKATEDKVKNEAQAIDEERQKRIASLSNSLTDALNELRKRPKRPSPADSPKDTGDSKACTGRELFQEDAEFLTREANRADRVLAERDFYYSQYESVRRHLDALTD